MTAVLVFPYFTPFLVIFSSSNKNWVWNILPEGNLSFFTSLPANVNICLSSEKRRFLKNVRFAIGAAFIKKIYSSRRSTGMHILHIAYSVAQVPSLTLRWCRLPKLLIANFFSLNCFLRGIDLSMSKSRIFSVSHAYIPDPVAIFCIQGVFSFFLWYRRRFFSIRLYSLPSLVVMDSDSHRPAAIEKG